MTLQTAKVIPYTTFRTLQRKRREKKKRGRKNPEAFFQQARKTTEYTYMVAVLNINLGFGQMLVKIPAFDVLPEYDELVFIPFLTDEQKIYNMIHTHMKTVLETVSKKYSLIPRDLPLPVHVKIDEDYVKMKITISL